MIIRERLLQRIEIQANSRRFKVGVAVVGSDVSSQNSCPLRLLVFPCLVRHISDEDFHRNFIATKIFADYRYLRALQCGGVEIFLDLSSFPQRQLHRRHLARASVLSHTSGNESRISLWTNGGVIKGHSGWIVIYEMAGHRSSRSSYEPERQLTRRWKSVKDFMMSEPN